MITLSGERASEAIVYSAAVEAGNKLIANLGLINMYGKSRSKMSRLTQPALANSSSFYVETGLDWTAGDRLGLLPTSFKLDAIDEVFVSSYDTATGLVTVNTTLQYYHFGKSESTASLYNGVDIRGEVVLLTRNIRIEGENVEDWGGQIVTGFMLETDLTTMRYGQTYMDNVEIYNCSQKDTSRAALRWSSNGLGNSTISNSVIHSGHAWAVNIQSSANIILQNNIIFGFKALGIVVQTATNVTIDGNVVANVTARVLETNDMSVDKEAGMAICSYNEPDSCSDISVINNIVAGVRYTGYAMFGHNCGESATQTVFRNNVAHSVDGVASGHGALFTTSDALIAQHATCFEASYFTAYKCT